MVERLRAYFLDSGSAGGVADVSTEMFDAVRASSPVSPLDFGARLAALAKFLGIPEASSHLVVLGHVAAWIEDDPDPRTVSQFFTNGVIVVLELDDRSGLEDAPRAFRQDVAVLAHRVLVEELLDVIAFVVARQHFRGIQLLDDERVDMVYRRVGAGARHGLNGAVVARLGQSDIDQKLVGHRIDYTRTSGQSG